MKHHKQKVSITLDEEVIRAIQILAQEEDRSFSQCINFILRKYIGTNRSYSFSSSTASSLKKQEN